MSEANLNEAVAAPAVVETPVVLEAVAPVVVEAVAPIAEVVAPVVEAVVAPIVETVAPVVVPVTRKPRKAKVAQGRGRPAVFVGKTLSGIQKLLRKTKNATLTRRILSATAAKSNKELVAQREAAGIADRTSISMPTLLKIAANAKIELQVGRPKAA